MRKALALLLIICAGLTLAATNAFYITDDNGHKIPFGTSGELHFQNISGLPNQVTVLTPTVDISAHTDDTTIHFTESSIDHTAIQNIGTNSHAALDTFVTDTTADINTLNSHAADSTIHFTLSSILHDSLTGASGFSNHSAIDAFMSEEAGTAAALSSHTSDSSIHFTASSINHDNLTGASGFYNHSTIDAHIDDTSIHGGGSGATIPPGTMWMFAGSSAPSGWLIADGSCVSRSTYADLFAVAGETYDACDSSTTFGLPDMRGRTAIGAGQGSGLTNRTLGQAIGEEAHSLTSAENGPHTHTMNVYLGSSGSVPTASGYNLTTLFGTPSTSSSGSGTGHNTIQPSLVINYIIKY